MEHSVNPDPAAYGVACDEFRCAPVVRLPLGSSAELLYFPLQKVARVLSAPESRVLGACSQFTSLAAHADRVLSGSPDGRADVLQALKTFAEQGMMLSRAELSKRLGELPLADTPPRISWLAIPTSNRPDLLRRALKSYAEHFSRSDRFPKLLVADDSPTPEACRASKEVVEEQGKDWGSAVVYSGPDEKRWLIDRLAEGGSLPRDVLEFGILGPGGYTPTMGANRNAILLQTVGEMVLSVDDDTICQPCAPPEADPATLRLGSDGDPTEFWFFPDRESALAFVCPARVDILNAHEALLGRQVWTLAGSPSGAGSVDLDFACGHLIQSIWMGTGRVLATLNGSIGDSGMYSGRNIPVHKQAETRRRLLRSEENYQSAVRSREILRQVRSAAVCHASPFMSMFFGMDNRTLLPPFFPLGRNEDGTFGYMLGRCFEGSYFGYLPWSLLHDPPVGRDYFGSAATTVRISDLLIASISTWTCSSRRAGAAERLRSLGRHLIEVASMAADDFGEYVRMLLWQQAAHRIAQKQALLRQHGEQPDFWAADLRRENEASEAAIVRPDYSVPIDLPEHVSGPWRLREAQGLIRRYGELVSWWPAIVEQAKG